jgi:hypothetical protein
MVFSYSENAPRVWRIIFRLGSSLHRVGLGDRDDANPSDLIPWEQVKAEALIRIRGD